MAATTASKSAPMSSVPMSSVPMSAPNPAGTSSAEPGALRPLQLFWLAGAVLVVSAGYGALMPLLPGWLGPLMQGAPASEIARHVGFLSGVYAAGVLVGAPLWGLVSDRVGHSRILFVGLIGYVASQLLLMIPALAGVWGIYMLRATAGFFVAAVVPVVAALVAEHTPADRRARRFAWMSGVSLAGFLVGPALKGAADGLASLVGNTAVSAVMSARYVLGLSALLGGVMMLGLARTLPVSLAAQLNAQAQAQPQTNADPAGRRTLAGRAALLWLNAVLLFVLAAFELGIVLQGQQQAGQSSRQAAIMFAECSLVMLAVNAVLFLTALLEKVLPHILIGIGLVLAMAGLGVMAVHTSDAWMFVGVGMTSAGTGLVLPVIAYLAASASPLTLGATMGGLAAAAGLGQTLGSAAGGWLFGALAKLSFAWIGAPLALMLVLLLVRPGWWSLVAVAPTASAGAEPKHSGRKLPP